MAKKVEITIEEKVRALFDLEMNLGDRIDAVSRLLSLEVNDIETDIKLLDDRLKLLEEK